MFIFNLLAGVGVGVGLFFIFCDLLRVPTQKTSMTMRGIERQYNKKESRINTGLGEVAVWLSKHLKIRDFKRAKMEANLNTARMTETPEMYMANCIVKAGVIGCMGLLLLPIVAILGAMILVVAVVYYFMLMGELSRKVSTHREAIEYELVQFVFTIERVLQNNRNVLLMLQNYREIAGPEMRQELDITLADMSSGNYEEAISRLEIRVGSVMMSDVCRGLISVIRGDDTTAYWVTLNQKFSEHQRDILKRKVEKVPAKVNRLSMGVLFAFLGLWLGVMIMQMVTTLADMFSAV